MNNWVIWALGFMCGGIFMGFAFVILLIILVKILIVMLDNETVEFETNRVHFRFLNFFRRKKRIKSEFKIIKGDE